MENHVLLTAEQLRAVTASPDDPVRLVDPASRQEFVLIRVELYDRVRELLDETHPRDSYPAIDRAFADGWDDPKMADYDRYEELRK